MLCLQVSHDNIPGNGRKDIVRIRGNHRITALQMMVPGFGLMIRIADN